MQQQATLIQALKLAIIATLGRTIDSPTDFDYLSIKISEKTGDVISVSTLKRLFGYIKPATVPRPSTLSSLARYVGYAGWSEFCAAQVNTIAPPKRNRYIVAVIVVIVLVVAGGIWYMIGSKPNADPATAKIDTIQIVDTVTIVDTVIVQTAPQATTTESHLSSADKCEIRLRECIKISSDICNNVHAKRSEMTKKEYRKFADSTYYAFVFNDLKKIIADKVAVSFAGDELLRQRYGNEIFSQCRDFCIAQLLL